MYGLLLEAIAEQIKAKYGEEVWAEVRKRAKVPHQCFSIHKSYSETVIPRITKALADVTGSAPCIHMNGFGTNFVSFVGRYGYDRILRVLGRNLRDFLNGLDNLHEYLRFSYPKMKPPSFFVEKESADGLVLHYRTKRKGYVHYVMGQIKEVALQFYNLPVKIEVISETETLDVTHVVMQLFFNNNAFKESDADDLQSSENLAVSSDVFFDVFPFHIVFNKALMIINIGAGLQAVMPYIMGQAIDEIFTLVRPMVEFTNENVRLHLNNVFEILSIDNVNKEHTNADEMDMDSEMGLQEHGSEYDALTDTYHDKNLRGAAHFTPFGYNDKSLRGAAHFTPFGYNDDDLDDINKKLKLKGQMMYIAEWDATIFLGTPVMDNLEKMFNTGLFINDLSMHDSSRDLVLAGTQQSAELKLALDQEQQKSKKLEESMRKLDLEMKRTDQLLYQMIPKTVADRLRRGEPAMATCQVFDDVTILFSDVVGFTRICSQITPMAVVSMLNAMYTKFDQLSEKHRVYKVETIGDAYMVVSGAPIVTQYHALYICDMAFDMLEAMTELIDPSTGQHMGIRVGIHSGIVVAGVVGLKMPRYCLFGDTVNTASRMEANGEAMKIHISETTYEHIEKHHYTCEERATIEVKGKGVMKTYWLLDRPTDMETSKMLKMDHQFKGEQDSSTTSQQQGEKRKDSSLFITEEGDTRSLYSPVLPEDVMKVSPTHLTKNNAANGVQSNLKNSYQNKDMKNGKDPPNNERDIEDAPLKEASTGDLIHNKLDGKGAKGSKQKSQLCSIV